MIRDRTSELLEVYEVPLRMLWISSYRASSSSGLSCSIYGSRAWSQSCSATSNNPWTVVIAGSEVLVLCRGCGRTCPIGRVLPQTEAVTASPVLSRVFVAHRVGAAHDGAGA